RIERNLRRATKAPQSVGAKRASIRTTRMARTTRPSRRRSGAQQERVRERTHRSRPRCASAYCGTFLRIAKTGGDGEVEFIGASAVASHPTRDGKQLLTLVWIAPIN